MRNRVLLARMLREPANLIIMDEPPNDLDLDTLRVLEEAIELYPGSMIIVTHDRYFLNRVATHILAFEGDGQVVPASLSALIPESLFRSYPITPPQLRASHPCRP